MRKMQALALGFVLMAGISRGEEEAKGSAPPWKSPLTPLTTKEAVETLRPLYTLKVDAASDTGAEPEKLVVKEVERKEKTSVVTATVTSGTKIGPGLYAMLALRRLAIERGAKFYVILRHEENDNGQVTLLVGFSATEESNPARYFGVKEPLEEKLPWEAAGEWSKAQERKLHEDIGKWDRERERKLREGAGNTKN